MKRRSFLQLISLLAAPIVAFTAKSETKEMPGGEPRFGEIDNFRYIETPIRVKRPVKYVRKL